MKVPLSPHPIQHLLSYCWFLPFCMKKKSVILISISLIARNGEHFFTCFLLLLLPSENSVQMPSPFSFFPLGFLFVCWQGFSVFFSPACFRHLCGIVTSWSYVYSWLVLILFYSSTGLLLCLPLTIWTLHCSFCSGLFWPSVIFCHSLWILG